LFLATPIKFSGRLIQYLGRVARSSDGKTAARVYDYHDVHVDVLMKAARDRMRTYKKLARQGQEVAQPTPKREFNGRIYK
jgi:superfamily II DNA or RNA helicase